MTVKALVPLVKYFFGITLKGRVSSFTDNKDTKPLCLTDLLIVLCFTPYVATYFEKKFQSALNLGPNQSTLTTIFQSALNWGLRHFVFFFQTALRM